MAHDGQLVPALLDDARQQRLRVRRGAGVDLVRAQAQDRRRPRAAPVPVGDHLAFVDHRHVVVGLQVGHLHGGGLHPAAGHADLLLARHQRAGHVVQVQRLKLLRRQQAQRPQVDAVARAAQPAHALVGLAGIGGPQVQDEPPLHLPRQRVQVPVVLRDGVEQRRAQLLLARQRRVGLPLQPLERGVSRLQDGLLGREAASHPPGAGRFAPRLVPTAWDTVWRSPPGTPGRRLPAPGSAADLPPAARLRDLGGRPRPPRRRDAPGKGRLHQVVRDPLRPLLPVDHSGEVRPSQIALHLHPPRP